MTIMSPAAMAKPHHFLVVAFPVQSHINPAIQFSKRLLRLGATVTLATAVSALNRTTTTTTSIPDGLTLAAISDGYNRTVTSDNKDTDNYLVNFKHHGSRTLSDLIERTAADDNRPPFTCLVYTLLITWAPEVARRFQIPSALLWIQPAALFNIYYHYFNGYGDEIKSCENDPEWSIELPGLQPLILKKQDIPSFLTPANPYRFGLSGFKEQFELLHHEATMGTAPWVLVNTFDALEPDALRWSANGHFRVVAVGSLVPSGFLDGNDPEDKSSGVDLFKRSEDRDYLKWLHSKAEGTVVYVSFGSLSVLSTRQMDKLARGVLDSGRPFLWVIRGEEEEERLSCLEEVEGKGGMIVRWCSQVEVLSHPAVGCFVTHCGWNSTMESLVAGVPMVGFPQWTDQMTNAKLIEDMWRVGVRVKEEEGGIVESEEIRRCVEIVMESEEMKENAKRLRQMAVEAAGDGGSSQRNLREFVDEFLRLTIDDDDDVN